MATSLSTVFWGAIPAHSVTCATLAPSNGVLATGSKEGHLCLWRGEPTEGGIVAGSWVPFVLVPLHSDPVKCLTSAVCNEHEVIVSASVNGTVALTSTSDGLCLTSVSGLATSSPTALQTLPYVRYVAYAGQDCVISIIDVKVVKVIARLDGHTSPAVSMSVPIPLARSAGEKSVTLTSASACGEVIWWRIEVLGGGKCNWKLDQTWNCSPDAVSVSHIPGRPVIVIVYPDRAEFYSSSHAMPFAQIASPPPVTNIQGAPPVRRTWAGGQFMSSRGHVALWTKCGTLLMFKPPEETLVNALRGICPVEALMMNDPVHPVEDVCRGSFGGVIAADTASGLIVSVDRAVDVRTWKFVRHFGERDDVMVPFGVRSSFERGWPKDEGKPRVTAVILVPETGGGTNCIRGFDNGEIEVITILVEQHLHTLRGHTSTVTCLYVLDNSNMLVSGSRDCTVRVWDIECGNLLHVFAEHVSPILALGDVPDGPNHQSKGMIYSVSEDHSTALLSIHALECLHVFGGHSSPVTMVHCLSWEDYVFVACTDGSLYVWQLSTGILERKVDGESAREIMNHYRLKSAGSESPAVMTRQTALQRRPEPRSSPGGMPDPLINDTEPMSSPRPNVDSDSRRPQSPAQDYEDGVEGVAMSAQALGKPIPKGPSRSSELMQPSNSDSIMGAPVGHKRAISNVPKEPSSHVSSLAGTVSNSQTPPSPSPTSPSSRQPMSFMAVRLGQTELHMMTIDIRVLVAELRHQIIQATSTPTKMNGSAVLALPPLVGALGYLLTWGVDLQVDEMCRENLKVAQPRHNISFCVRGYRGTLSIMTPYWDGSLRLACSNHLCAVNSVSVVATSRALTRLDEYQTTGSKLIATYGVIIPETVKYYHQPSLETLSRFWLDPSDDIQQAARCIFDAAISRLSPEGMATVQKKWFQQVPVVTSTTSSSALIPVWILGMIAALKPESLDKDTAMKTLEALRGIMRHRLSGCIAATDLLGQGFPLWSKVSEQGPSQLFKDMFDLALFMTKEEHPSAKVISQIFVGAGALAAESFAECMVTEALRVDVSSGHNTSAIFAICAMAKAAPHALLPSLVFVVEAILRCLDPSMPTRRKACLDACTTTLRMLVSKFPMMSFHQRTQRLAVGTKEKLIIVYELRSATRLRVLEGHAAEVNAVAICSDGERVASYSISEKRLRIWGLGTGLLSLLGTQGKCIKKFAVPDISDRLKRVPASMKILPVRLDWTSDTTVALLWEERTVRVYAI